MTTLRPAQPEDIAAVLTLWQDSAEPSSTDDVAAVTALLEHEPGALIIAESSGQIVGSVIAAWDGWRAAGDRISARGARRLQATVIETDTRAMGFWRGTDWRQAEEQTRFTRG
jgi:hypothetical protein